jgi:hypothetical protein
MRALQSLADMLGIISPVVPPQFADAASKVIASIQHHFECVESAFSVGLAELSVEFHALLIFIRSLEQLRSCFISQNPDHDGDITDIVEKICLKMKPEQQILCKIVKMGRDYVFHGADMRRTLALLQCTCAVAQLLRVLLSQNSAHAPSCCKSADKCDTSVVLLIQRMGISDIPSLMKEAVANHHEM